ncbi:uncharacterized protein DFL_000639 [Arthrobotrys flagrans]|uniref:Uncharacterized protein n=1 Tax=Arthrobotrys flagrans TaxID=97331 RepID=A0A437AFH5_ARTFL|nr:hypothetical protein DFL_000639 [Arthrobotrys flagrans]
MESHSLSSNLNRRDHEDPLNVPGNNYTITHKQIKRRVSFVDEDGELELLWTSEGLAARTASEERGVKYVKPYILMRRAMAMERGNQDTAIVRGEKMDMFANLGERLPLGQELQQQGDTIFEQLIATIDGLDDDADRQHMMQVPLESSERSRGGERAADIDARRNAIDRALNSAP